MCDASKEVLFGVAICLASVLTCCSGRKLVDSLHYGGGVRDICVPLYKCPLYLEEIHKHHKISFEFSALLRSLNCGYDGKNPRVWCEITDRPTVFTTRSPIWRPPIVTENPITSFRYNKIHTDSPLHEFWRPRPPAASRSGVHRNMRLLPTQCGESEEDRIIGGTTAELNSFPWMVQLLYRQKGEGTTTNYCGGTLINDRYVLTAAHCILFEGDRILHQVVLGEHDMSRNPDCYKDMPNKCFYIKKMTIRKGDVIVHENFSPKLHDIALIRLPERVDLSLDNIRPICLPTTEELRNQDLEGACALVTGWGVLKDNSVESSTLLQQARLPVISKEECTRTLHTNIENSQLCTGVFDDKEPRSKQCANSHAVDSCRGDSGGPLAYNENVTGKGLLVQWGIISFGGHRCAADVPTVHTRVSEYMDWILDHIRE